jgi:hypothetical protein
MSYLNTTNQTNPKLAEYRTKALSQDEIILKQFERFPNKEISASMLWKGLQAKGVKWPLTSIRRSINTLKSSDKIEETGNKMEGVYGRDEFTYWLKK